MLKFLLILSGLLMGGVSTAQTADKGTATPDKPIPPDSSESVPDMTGPAFNNQISTAPDNSALDDPQPFSWSSAYAFTENSPSLFELMEFCKKTLQKIIPDCQTLHPVTAWRIKEIYDDIFYHLESSFLEKLSELKMEGFSTAQIAEETASILDKTAPMEKAGTATTKSSPQRPVNALNSYWKRISLFTILEYQPPTIDDPQPFSWSSAYNSTKNSPNLSELMDFCRWPITRIGRRLCVSLPPVLVWRIKDHAVDVLDSDFAENLQNIDPAILELTMKIDISFIHKRIKTATRSEISFIKNWLMENEWAIKIIAGEDDRYRVFGDLFTMSLSEDDFHYPVSHQLNQFVQGILSLPEDKDNEAGLEWVFSFFNESCWRSEKENLCAFEKYCQLNLTRLQEMKLIENSSDFEDLFYYKILENYFDAHPRWNGEMKVRAEDLHSGKSFSHICVALSGDFVEF